MQTTPVKCPGCGKTIIFYGSGCDAVYELKCHNNKCGCIVRIYSAGKTAVISENLSFGQYEHLVKSNRGIDITKVV